MQGIPTFETERLTLRAHKSGDLPALAAMWADPDVVRYISGKPFSETEVSAKMVRHLGHWVVNGYGYWVLEDRATGGLVGEAGFADFKRGIPELDGVPELGWVLATPWHGRGYATEAVRAATAWGDTTFGKTKTACIINPANAASIRVAGKAGYQEALRTKFHDEPTILYYRNPCLNSRT